MSDFTFKQINKNEYETFMEGKITTEDWEVL